MVSAVVPDWISRQGVEENAKELQAALEQEQAGSLARFSSHFPLNLRNPPRTPFLGPNYHHGKPECYRFWTHNWSEPHFLTV